MKLSNEEKQILSELEHYVPTHKHYTTTPNNISVTYYVHPKVPPKFSCFNNTSPEAYITVSYVYVGWITYVKHDEDKKLRLIRAADSLNELLNKLDTSAEVISKLKEFLGFI